MAGVSNRSHPGIILLRAFTIFLILSFFFSLLLAPLEADFRTEAKFAFRDFRLLIEQQESGELPSQLTTSSSSQLSNASILQSPL